MQEIATGYACGRPASGCRRVFFFQAEDGIRDLTVTGVQTCALPISPGLLGERDLQARARRSRAGAPRPWRRALRAAEPVRRRPRTRPAGAPFLWRRPGQPRRACRRPRGRAPAERHSAHPHHVTEIAAATPIVDTQLGSLFTACVVRVEREGQREALAAGTLCPDDRAGPDAPCTGDSVFDLASLTKLATTALLLSFVRERQLTLDTPLPQLVPDFQGARKDPVTP